MMLSEQASPRQGQQQGTVKAFLTGLRLLVWLLLSSSIILFNKWLLSPQNFPYPVTLAFWHMLFCSIVGILAVQTSCVPRQKVRWSVCYKICLPVAALGAIGLTLGNVAFIHLSVAFAQMLKANMPVIMFIVGCLFRTHNFSWRTCGIMMVIGAGAACSSLGEVHFFSLGATFMLLAMLAEACKMVLLQTMMQQTDLQINPINALYYVMPASTICLLPFVLALEANDIRSAMPKLTPQAPALVGSAVAACLLNLVAFWVVSTTSALTMKLAGIVKDAVLIVTAAFLFKTPLKTLGLAGYIVALTGIGIHYQSLTEVQDQAASSATEYTNPLLFKSKDRACVTPQEPNVDLRELLDLEA